jgi:hypothetical protein
VFLGGLGTGKTTIAKLYSGILVDLGLLSKVEGKLFLSHSVSLDCGNNVMVPCYQLGLGLQVVVVIKNPSDFVGDILGGSEKHTKGILAASLGKVLVINKAYSLYASGS